MQTPRAYWPAWVEYLRDRNLDSFAAWLLEAGGPFTLLAAQMLYILRPFHSFSQVEALADMLEQSDETRAFVTRLRGERPA